MSHDREHEYDAFKAGIYDGYFTGVEGDVPFYVEEAQRTLGADAGEAGGAVLELGCGTGRITFALAQAGFMVVGLDNSQSMLDNAYTKSTTLPPEQRARVTLVAGDMRKLTLKQRFPLILIPYRAFMHLLTPQDQIQALLSMRTHLTSGGRLILNLYDPTTEWLAGQSLDAALRYDTTFTHPDSGLRIATWYSRRFDLERQWIEQQMIFEELDEMGRVTERHVSPLTLRYSHRYEMHYLLELCGYEVDELYGDFQRKPFSGSEQVWVAHRARRM
jgi:SAM-dependent methyltransferase